MVPAICHKLSAICELRASLVDQGKAVTQSKNRAKSKSSPARRIGVSLIASLMLLSMPGALRAQNPSKVTIAYSAVSPIFAGVWMAKEIGAFEKQGLKADLVYVSSGSVTVQAMVGGNLDVSIAASNAVVSSILRGAPLVAVGSITNRPAMSLFVQPEITKIGRASCRERVEISGVAG